MPVVGRRAAFPFFVAAAVISTLTACSFMTDFDVFSTPTSQTPGSTDAGGSSGGPPDGSATSGSDTGVVGGGDGSTSTTTAYATAVLSDEPLAYLRFEEISGTLATDSTGNNHHATVESDYAWGVPGVDGKALKLTSAAIDFGEKFDFAGNAPYTLEAWINAGIVDNEYRHIFTKSIGSSAQGNRQAYGLFVQGDAIEYERFVSGSKVAVHKYDFPNVHLNRWTHVVATYDGVVMALYIDGLKTESAQDSRPQAAKGVSLLAGARQKFSGTFAGSIDELAIYDKALGIDRVQAHFNTAPPR